MQKIIILISFLIVANLSLCQESQEIQKRATLFEIPDDEDTIQFIVVDTAFQSNKPIFLWCQGSLPQPLFGEILDQNGEWSSFFQGGGIANFNYERIKEDYHLVVISMPHTPVVVSKENLSKQFLYVPDINNPRELSEAYIEADYLENYVSRGNRVLKFLTSKDWISKDQLVVAGASQGAKVATQIAANNPLVTHLGLFSPNPFGRIDQFVRQPRLDAQLGRITWEEADSLIREQYDFFKRANNSDSLKAEPRLKAWKTFSVPSFDDWLTMEIPIYLAYGTEDRSADLCDIIPLMFIAAGKDNLTLKRNLHLEHNFFEVEEDGRANFQKGHWNEVMMEFIEWLNKKL